MIAKRFRVVLSAAFLLVGGAGIVLVKLDNNRLRERVDVVRKRNSHMARLQNANQQTRELLTRNQRDEHSGAQAIHEELMRVRAQVNELEQQALTSHRQLMGTAAKNAASLATNRNPERGMTLLENFQETGQHTPGAAFQTFVWATLKGEDSRLAGMLAVDGSAREKLQATIAGLPASERAKYPTPESLAALFFAAHLTGRSSAEISNVAFQDGQHATVSVLGLTDNVQKVPMLLTSTGWKIVVPEEVAQKLERWVRGRTPEKE